MSTIDRNKLLAEFMGLDTIYLNKPMYLLKWKGNLVQKKDDTIFKFDSDWNWLMELVEKIESKKSSILIRSNWNEFKDKSYYQVSIRIEKGEMSADRNVIHNSIDIYHKHTSGDTKLQAVYNACVEFIKWYNNQNQ